MNSSTSQSTGHTSAYLSFAREMRNPENIQREIIIGENFVSEVIPYLMKVADTLKKVTEIHEREQDRRKEYADQSRQQAGYFKVGDQVMIKTRMLSNAPQGITSKFAPKRDGPYTIVKRISPVSYQIADSHIGELLSVHHVPTSTHGKEINPETSSSRSGPGKEVVLKRIRSLHNRILALHRRLLPDPKGEYITRRAP